MRFEIPPQLTWHFLSTPRDCASESHTQHQHTGSERKRRPGGKFQLQQGRKINVLYSKFSSHRGHPDHTGHWAGESGVELSYKILTDLLLGRFVPANPPHLVERHLLLSKLTGVSLLCWKALHLPLEDWGELFLGSPGGLPPWATL